MPIDPVQLLKQLEPAVRPVGSRAAAAPPALFEDRSFDDLLTLVSSGSISSGRPVRATVDLDPPLDDAQRDRLAAAADLAEASGAGRALMLIDGRGLVLDVADRSITAEHSAGAPAPVIRLDAAVYVAGDESPPVRPVAGPAVSADLLARLQPTRDTRTV